MKTSLLLILILSFSFVASAQKYYPKQSSNYDHKVLLKKPCVDDATGNATTDIPYCKPVNKFTSAKGVFETMIGSTVYDAQTNSAVANRIFAYPDGTKGAVWTMGFGSTAYADRGTGYNYFDGTTWGEEPTTRIESMRTGWPSYYPLGNGELIVAHDFIAGLQISQRPLKGTGAWTTSFLAAPAGATKVSWPRVIAVGNTIHILAITGVPYQGLDLALLYYRSTDGGASWESPVILPGLDAASLGAGTGKSFSGFGSDAYAWAAPRGDTIAFAVASGMGGAWIMKSTDNGVSWTKKTVLSVPVLTDPPSPIMASTDGSISVALDSKGDAHVVFGRMFVSDNDFVAAGYSYYPYTDGLIYWNESMPELDTTQLANTEMLEDQGNLIAWMKDYNGNNVIDFPEVGNDQFPFGLYGSSLSSMGQIIIDENDKLFVTYSSCREDLVNSGANPNAQLYRHLYLTEKINELSGWSVPRDLNDNIEHSYDECVFASLASNTEGGIFSYLNILYHLDPEPGTSIGADEDTPGDNYVYYLTVASPPPAVKPSDLVQDVMISPNPAGEFTNVQVQLNSSSKVEINIYDAMGKLVMNNNYGGQTSGNHTYKVNTSSLTSGMYLFSVKTGSSQISRKVVVE
jgi:hypothetical protein